jgi:hypothetical protein
MIDMENIFRESSNYKNSKNCYANDRLNKYSDFKFITEYKTQKVLVFLKN